MFSGDDKNKSPKLGTFTNPWAKMWFGFLVNRGLVVSFCLK
jgi:hypothetical protein